MANIKTYLNNIKTAVFGSEVRDSIHDAIQQCYDDASAKDNANMEVKMARGEYENLGKRLDSHSSQIKDKANQVDLKTLENRMNTFVEVGESSDNAETVDIRVGADGTVYGSAGEAVRKQVNYLKEKDYNVNDNSFKPDYVLNPGYLAGDGSVRTENTNFSYSNKIKLLAGQVIRIGTHSIPNAVTVLGEYKDDTHTTPLITADSNDFKYYYYQAPREMYVCFCVRTAQSYSIDIVYNITSQLFNDFFNMNNQYTDYSINLANSFEKIDKNSWQTGYYKSTGELSTETGAYVNLQLEPNSNYLVLVGGYNAELSIVGLNDIDDTTGKIIKLFKGERIHILNIKTPSTGIIGVCTNERFVSREKVLITNDFGTLKDIVDCVVNKGDVPNNFEVEYMNGEVIPAITKNGNLMPTFPSFTQGYWHYVSGKYQTDNSVCCSVQLEPNTEYFAYVGGYSNETTGIVSLDTLEITNGTPLAKIPFGANIVEFRTGETGIVGLCTNEKFVKRTDLSIFKKEAGLITQMLLPFINEYNEDIECYVGDSSYQNEKHYYKDPVSCFKAIQNHQGHKIVHIYSGIYDIYELMGGYDYFSQINPTTQRWQEVQPVLDNVEIICHGHVEFNMALPLSLSSEIRWLISPLNVRGDFVINNLVINAENVRYCIHDESNDDYPSTTHEYNNVYCKINKNQAVGCGYSKNSTVKISKCYFESGDSHSYSYHSKGGCNIIINDSILKSNSSIPLRLSEENTKVVDKAVISNTILITNNSQKIEIRGEWDYSDVNTVGYTDIKLINTNVNNVSQIKNGYTSNSRDVVAYNTKEGTENILIQKS